MAEIEAYAREVRRLVKDIEAMVIDVIEYYATICTRCLLCRSLCPVYRAAKEDIYSPEYRLRAALKVARGQSIDKNIIKSLYSCLLCGSCAMTCPYGINVWLAVLLARYKLALKGILPRGLREVVVNVSKYGHSFTTDPERALKWARTTGAPLDKAADYLYVPSPLENIRFPEKIEAKTRLMEILGISYTVSSKIIDLGGNAGIDASRIDIGLAMLWRAYEEAEKLGAKGIIVSECGSDVKLSLVVFPVASRALGLKPQKIKHFYDIISLKLRAGLASSSNAVFFTSCNFCRFTDKCPAGLLRTRQPRDRKPYTQCCGGGGGYTISQEKWMQGIRRSIAARRIESLREETIIVPCIKCYTTLREAALLRRVKKKVKLFSEVLLEAYSRARSPISSF